MKIYSINTGCFSTDGGAMFGVISKKIWSSKYPVDKDNRCPLCMRSLFVDTGENRVLFDAGVGNVHVSGASYYKFHDMKDLSAELQKIGYEPDTITDIVLSHLHFDHCGGIIKQDEDGGYTPVFKNARYWTGINQYYSSFNPEPWEADSFDPNASRAMEDTGRLNLISSDSRIFPWLNVRVVQGHTYDQLVSYIQTPAGELVFTGDVIPMATHVLPMCIASVDNSAVVSIKEKMPLLEDAAAGNHVLFFYHDAVNEAVRVKKIGKRIVVSEEVDISGLLSV